MMPAGMEPKNFHFQTEQDFDFDDDDEDFEFDFGKANTNQSVELNNLDDENKSPSLVYEVNNNFYCDEAEFALDDLKDAILSKNLNIVKEIMGKFEIDVNCMLKSNWIPIMYAVSCGSYELTEYFIENGADINFDDESYNLLMCACGCVDPCASEMSLAKIIDLLISKGADINQCDKYYQTPLMYACRAGNTLLIDCIIKYNVDLNAKDDNDWTSLAHASSKGNYKCVHKLLRLGADPLICSIDYLYPYDIAQSYGFNDIRDLIKNYLRAKKIENLKGNDKFCDIVDIDASEESSFLPEKSKDELEIFLRALRLPNLIENFRQSNVTMSKLLNYNEADLKNIGVFDEFARQIITYETKKFHHKNWLSSSLIPVKHDTVLSCNEAISIVCNISRHLDFINQNVKYLICDSSEYGEFYEDEFLNSRLFTETKNAFQNCNKLKDSIEDLYKNVKKEKMSEDADPIDLVKPTRKKKWSKDPLKITALATIAISGIFIIKTKFFS